MDLRIVKTRIALKNALCDLVNDNDFEKITVKDICKRASVNRITFYDHYKDKYDLLNDIFIELDNNAIENGKILDKENNPLNDSHKSLINYLLSYVNGLITRSSLIKSMAKHMSGYIYFAFTNFLNNRFRQLLNFYNQESNLIYSPEQTTAFICNGLIGFVIAGINNSSTEDLSEEFYKAQKLFHSLINNHIFINKK